MNTDSMWGQFPNPLVEHIETDALEVLANVSYSTQYSLNQQAINIEAFNRVKTLMEDVGLSPNRKYSISEIDRLKLAIEWALGGD